MANQYINLYKNDPTAGQTDGSAISTDGTQLNPLEVSLDATTEESKKVKLAVRTESLYTASGDVTINDYNDTNDRWKFFFDRKRNFFRYADNFGREQYKFDFLCSSVKQQS